MQLIQHISLLGAVSKHCRTPFSWSTYEDKCAILLKNGIYIMTLTPVPSNLSPSLNTFPQFFSYDEEPVTDLHWLPKGRLLTRALDGTTTVIDISSGEKQEISGASSVSCSHQEYLFWGDEQYLHAMKNEEQKFTPISQKKLSANISEILALQVAASKTLLFVSLANGLLTVIQMQEGELKEVTDSTTLWNDVDYQPASHLAIINQDFLESGHCFLAFSKGLYVVLTQVDLGSFSVLKQQCIQVTTNRIVKLLPYKENTCILATESGPLIEIVIDGSLERPCVYTPLNVDLDYAQYNLNGFQCSTNRHLWCVLQQGPYRQGENAKARVVILSHSTLSTLLSNPAIHTSLREKVDYLELLRVLLLRCNCLPSLKEDLLLLATKSSKSFMYWLAILLSEAGMDNEWPQMAYNGAKELMVSAALKRVQSDSSFNSSSGCIQFLQRFHPEAVTEHAPGLTHWRCPTCSSPLSDHCDFLDVVTCQKGCQWPRCCISYQVCDQKRTTQCGWCGAVALSQFQTEFCPLCTGIMKE